MKYRETETTMADGNPSLFLVTINVKLDEVSLICKPNTW